MSDYGDDTWDEEPYPPRPFRFRSTHPFYSRLARDDSSYHDGSSLKSDFSDIPSIPSIKSETTSTTDSVDSLSSEEKEKMFLFKESRKEDYVEPFYQKQQSQSSSPRVMRKNKRDVGRGSRLSAVVEDSKATMLACVPTQELSDAVTTTSEETTPFGSLESEEKMKLLMDKPFEKYYYHEKHPIGSPYKKKRNESCKPLTLSSESEYDNQFDFDVVTDQGGTTGPEAYVVWPPMVILMNTRVDKLDDNKWNGMTSSELLTKYGCPKTLDVLHAYGPEGHTGMSLLVFEKSITGYLASLELNSKFAEQHRGRIAWEQVTTPVPNELYGFAATGKDLKIFNHQVPDDKKVRFGLKQFEEIGIAPAGVIREEDQQPILDAQRNVYSARIRLIHRKVQLEESIFKDSFERDDVPEDLAEARIGKLKLYEAERAELVSSHEEGITELLQRHMKQEIEESRTRLNELIDLEVKFAVNMTALMGRYRQCA